MMSRNHGRHVGTAIGAHADERGGGNRRDGPDRPRRATAAKASLCAAATRATTWDSISTAAAPVVLCSSRFFAGSAIGVSTPTIGAWMAPAIMPRSLRDHTASVGADGLRFADGGSDHPISGAQVRGEPAGDAEADHAAVTLPDGAVGHRRQLASGRAANDQDPGARGDARLEVQTDECDDQATRLFDSSIGDPTRVVTFIHQSIYESSAGEIQLGCHKKPLPLASVA